MGNLVLAGSSSGSTTITPASTGTYTITLPAETGTIQTSGAGFTTNGVAYATSTSALATGSGLVFTGTNLGVGTASPTSLLQVEKSFTGTIAKIKNNAGATSSDAGLEVETSTTGAKTLLLKNAGTEIFSVKGDGTAYFNGTVGIGTSSPVKALDVSYSSTSTTATSAATMQLVNPQNAVGYYSGVINFCRINSSTPMAYIGSIQTDTTGNSANGLVFGTRNGTSTVDEKIRIDADGSLYVGSTSSYSGEKVTVNFNGSNQRGMVLKNTTSSTQDSIAFVVNSSVVGWITASTTNTTYNTSSDYRLKNTIAPMTGALAKVALLKPVTYKWNLDNSDAEGFIAHELAEVCPHAVSGTKDEVDADGNPKYQGIDTSFLVATLTSAIQELSALVTAQSATITSLTERITALEGK